MLLDSNHAQEHVAKELRLYGPLAAVRESLASHPEFQIDRSREAMLLTRSSSGYLKKVRE